VATTLRSDAAANDQPLADDQLRQMLATMKLARYVDERLEALYRQGRLPGAIYSGRGQEGTHVGVVSALRPGDSLFPTHRDLTAQLAKGLDLNRVLAQFWGRIDGYLRGRDGNSHIGDWDGNRTYAVMSHLPIAYPVAVGAAWAYQRAGDGRVALAICGDGATSNGRWHEAINWSSVERLPVVWVVNNNQFAYSTPNEKEFAVPTIAERGAAYGIPGVRVDGTDVLEVYRAAREAVDRARGGGGPSLIESVSLRWRGHAGHDPAKYVPGELLDHYTSSKDPVMNFEQHLRQLGLVDDDALAEMQREIEQRFEEAHAFALGSPFPEAGDVNKGMWVEDGYWRAEPGRGGGTEAS
jgi:TPP-dependent pyruvate/acetoin dehydrogenase alpha subunit